jgi:putative membrane protein
MTTPPNTPENLRRPRVFAPDDPKLVAPPEPVATPDDRSEPGDEPLRPRARTPNLSLPTVAGVSKGVRFGAIFVSALVSLATLAATLSFIRFVSVALERDDWIGWTAAVLLALAALSGLVLVARELIGLARLARLGRLRRDMDTALATKDADAEREGLTRLKTLYAGRQDLRWPLDRLSAHERDIHDPGRLLALADRELMAPLDAEARKLVLRSAKRVSKVTALSPWAFISVGYVLVENIGLLRKLAALYGGRPGVLGSLRLAKLVVAHIVGTGGVALTDDLLGQFFGQDVLRRLSRRLGEGVFNGALTVRLGAAALDVIRPMPFIEAPPVRARDILKELWASEEKGGGRGET